MSDQIQDHERTTRRAELQAASQERRAAAKRRPSLPRVDLPDIQIPQGAVDATTSVRRVAVERFGALADRTRPVWIPVLKVLRWVSPLGWAVLGLGVMTWIVGVHYSWTEWLMIAAAALALFACCVLLALGRTRVKIASEVDPMRVTVGDPASGRVSMTNESRRRMLPLLVELPVGESAARFTLPSLAGGTAHEELFVVPTSHRGVIPVGPARTVLGDPLGLVRRTIEWTDVHDLYVHPRTVSLESLGAGLLRDLEGETTQDLSMSDLAFHALREYQPGDDRRYIHWRSSAKAGRLLVRQFLDTRRSHLTAIIDTDPASYTGGDEDVEAAISAAASLVVRAIMDEQDTTVVARGESASRTTAALTLDALARVEAGPADLFSMAGDAVAQAPDTSMAFVVTGPKRPFIELQRTLGQFELEVSKVALVIDQRERVGVRHAGGVTLLAIGHLEDLRRVLVSGALT